MELHCTQYRSYTPRLLRDQQQLTSSCAPTYPRPFFSHATSPVLPHWTQPQLKHNIGTNVTVLSIPEFLLNPNSKLVSTSWLRGKVLKMGTVTSVSANGTLYQGKMQNKINAIFLWSLKWNIRPASINTELLHQMTVQLLPFHKLCWME